jgi:hypothetical protein
MSGDVILAIDPATRSGVADGAPGSAPRLSVENFRHDETDDLADIYGRATFWLADRLRTNPPTLIVIEAPVPPSGAKGFTNHSTTMVTIGLFGIFVGIAKCKGIVVRTVHIATWRKHFLGRGNLPGDEAKRQCVKMCRMFDWGAPDHNAAEAAGIWSWGRSQLTPKLARRVEPLLVEAGK